MEHFPNRILMGVLHLRWNSFSTIPPLESNLRGYSSSLYIVDRCFRCLSRRKLLFILLTISSIRCTYTFLAFPQITVKVLEVPLESLLYSPENARLAPRLRHDDHKKA